MALFNKLLCIKKRYFIAKRDDFEKKVYIYRLNSTYLLDPRVNFRMVLHVLWNLYVDPLYLRVNIRKTLCALQNVHGDHLSFITLVRVQPLQQGTLLYSSCFILPLLPWSWHLTCIWKFEYIFRYGTIAHVSCYMYGPVFVDTSHSQGCYVKNYMLWKVLSEEINMWNMKALSLTVHKLWPRLKFLNVGQPSRSRSLGKN